MSCRICGRYDCIESFHSLAEQEKYEEVSGKLILKKEYQNKMEEAEKNDSTNDS